MEAALFIKRIYQRILDDYFKQTSFFKPTGDGLLIIVTIDPIDEKTLKNLTNEVIRISLKVVKDFPKLCKGDPLINFDVPQRVGIGLARGAACRLQTDETILDYAGTTLNLASRLMDLARPEGIVFSESFGLGLLGKPLREQFVGDMAYVRGIAEREPLTVFHTRGITQIPEGNKKPLDQVKWHEQELWATTLREIEEVGTWYYFEADQPVLDENRLSVEIMHPALTKGGRKHANQWSAWTAKRDDVAYREDRSPPEIRLNMPPIYEMLSEHGVKSGWPVRLVARYVVA